MEFDSLRGGGSLKALLVAVDGGPRETLAPLAAALECALTSIEHPDAGDEVYWSRALANCRCTLLVVGTSDSEHGRRIESAARRAACAAGICVVAVEDFPGNYFDVTRGAASHLIVESAAARDMWAQRLGARTPLIAVVPPARYDALRARAAELRRTMTQAWAHDPTQKVLWAGQPETADCMRTLEALLPVLRAYGVTLLLKAHPRDSGHGDARYRALLEQSRVPYEDFTHTSVEAALAAAPRIVVTQFSSVAIHAGFYGVPGLWLLLPEAGGARLLQKKGYALPMLCAAGGAAAATDAAAVPEALRRVLADDAYRENLLGHFDVYVGGEAALPTLLEYLRNAARDPR